jgi:hypothetical protein
MSALTPERYHKAENDFKIAFGICAPLLSFEAAKDIEHYVQHSELEMAYESLGMSLKAENVEVPRAVKEILYPLGPLLEVDKEGVLNANFWEEVSPILKP